MVVGERDEVVVRDSYVDQINPVINAHMKIHRAKSDSLVPCLLLDTDKYKAVIIMHPVSLDISENSVERFVLPPLIYFLYTYFLWMA